MLLVSILRLFLGSGALGMRMEFCSCEIFSFSYFGLFHQRGPFHHFHNHHHLSCNTQFLSYLYYVIFRILLYEKNDAL